MKTLSLEDEEFAILTQMMDMDLSRLRMEIAHTDRRDFKQFLKEREKVMENISRKIGTA